jgi:hypothetical protein
MDYRRQEEEVDHHQEEEVDHHRGEEVDHHLVEEEILLEEVAYLA